MFDIGDDIFVKDNCEIARVIGKTGQIKRKGYKSNKLGQTYVVSFDDNDGAILGEKEIKIYSKFAKIISRKYVV